MPTSASSFVRACGTVCRALVLIVLLSPIVLVTHVLAQSKPAPGLGVQAVGTTNLSGAAEVPGPGDRDGTGTAPVQIDVGSQQACATLNVQNIATATAAHIHRGAAGVAGPIVVGLVTPTGGSSNGCVPLNQIVAME